MTRTILLAVIAATAIAGCGGESQLPTASGKGTVRMINAIPTSPEVGFLIEERALEGVAYKTNSSPQNWDDLAYTFNFEVNRPGLGESQRIASQFIDVTRDIEYTFVLRGSVDAATVDVWEIPVRSFSGTETIFEMRIGHAAEALGTIDVYIGLESAAPDLGERVATLAPGEVSTPTDIEEDAYLVTITSAGNPADILFQSAPTRRSGMRASRRLRASFTRRWTSARRISTTTPHCKIASSPTSRLATSRATSTWPSASC